MLRQRLDSSFFFRVGQEAVHPLQSERMCKLDEPLVFSVFKCILCVLLIKKLIFFSVSLSLSVVTLCRATVIYFLEGAIAVLAAELPWRSASVFHKVSVKVEGALHNRFAPSHSQLKKYC